MRLAGIFLSLCMLSGLSACAPAVKVNAPGDLTPEMIILVTGATNGRLEVCNCEGPLPGGLSARSGAVQAYRKTYPNVRLIDTGDVFWIEPDGLLNQYILRGYQMLGYDAVVMGDQEWAADDQLLKKQLRPGPKYLSTTIHSDTPLPIVEECRFPLPNGRHLTLLSDVQKKAFLFFPKTRLNELHFKETQWLKTRIGELHKNRDVVMLVVHGPEEQVRNAAQILHPDLILWGHIQNSASELLNMEGVPVVKIAGSEMLGVLSLSIVGGKPHWAFRQEIMDEHWPQDPRLRKLFDTFLVEFEKQRKNSKKTINDE